MHTYIHKNIFGLNINPRKKFNAAKYKYKCMHVGKYYTISFIKYFLAIFQLILEIHQKEDTKETFWPKENVPIKRI